MEKLLTGREILVTGSSRGIGLEISRLLNENGAQIIGISRSKPVEKDKKIFIEHYKCDFSDLDDLNKTIKVIIKKYHSLNGLVSNVGFGRFGALETFSTRQIKESINVNLTSHIIVASLIVPLFKKKKFGDIIFMGSESSIAGAKNGSLYSAAKFGLRGLSQALRKDCANQSVRVSIVNPGFVRTEFFKSLNFEPAMDKEAALDPKDVANVILNILASGSGGVIEEVLLAPQKKNIIFK